MRKYKKMLKEYTIFLGKINCHYLIADASGHWVLLEFSDEELQRIEREKEYQISSNFIAYDGLTISSIDKAGKT